MENLSRRTVLTLGAALGIAGAAGAASPAWAWSGKGSVAGTDTVADPFQVWDDTADAVAAALLADGQVDAVNAAWQGWIDNNAPLPAGMPDYLTSYLRQVNKLPSWADPVKLAASEKLYTRLSSYLFVSETLGSGIMSTVIPREARAVYWSAGGADMKQRAAKTFTFGYDLHNAKAWDPDGHFVVTANKTRLVHAAVRNLLPTSAKYQAGADQPKPISNGDILRTFHSVATFARSNMLKWHISLSQAEQEADLHAWQVALHLLGVQERFIPKTWADAETQADQMLWPVLGPTSEGVSLAHTLLGYLENPVLGLDSGFLNELVRYLLNDQMGDWLGLPRDYVQAALIRVEWPAYVAFREGVSKVKPGSFWLFDQFVRGISMLYLNNGTSPTQTPITLPTANRPGA
ncbi:oxygenase MpaB family protein [Amycolatopsis benzoatilytica]|uniref:oxygenase MpaB family protein n=1 Tax=Amycolatopsis benzoatilytica TaxID=346045 RepID=UPI00036C4985|nr:oxygenase MpaB family protein [Amycolatopsis benzoatilytica]